MKKTGFALLIVAIVQTFLLINMIVAQSYMINQIDNLEEDSEFFETKENNSTINFVMKLLRDFLSIKQIGIVSASKSSYCCPETTTGNLCQTYYFESWRYDEYSDLCKYDLINGNCNNLNCERCCPETNQGDLCKDVNLNYQNCERTLVNGYCSSDCIHCCPETNEGIFCQDVSMFHQDMCAENLYRGSCASLNCREMTYNDPGLPPPQDTTDLDVSWNCCFTTTDGAICQDIPSITPELCAVTPLPTSCDNTANCKIGCCFDSVEGLCTTNSPKQKCESENGAWDEDDSCLIQECQKGCCVLGGNVQFVTETRCERLSLTNGFEKDFRDLTTEAECLALAASQFKGACIFQGESCSINTEAECLSNNGDFYQDYLCSNPNLETICERQEFVNCIEGEDEIYWFDSCGNQENIYSSDRDASWNNGKILTKEESCNSDSANIDSEDCGNCNYFLGSRCSVSLVKKIKDGDFVCKSMKCIDEKGNVRENGESWCVYDSYIGDGKDTVGSRHWKRYCVEGEIETEPCADYRGAVCAQSVIEENGKTFSIASCVANEAVLCLDYNSDLDTMEEKCNENKHCMIKNINVDSYFRFDICVGRYPRGFDLKDSSGASDGICSMASQTCTVLYMKDWKGRWKCEENCNCESREFAKQMNDLCVSLGDCGSYINYGGGGTDNIKVSGAPSVSWKDYKKYSKPVDGQFVEPQDIDKFLSSIGGTSTTIPGEEESAFAEGVEFLGTISGATGGLIGAGMYLGSKGIVLVTLKASTYNIIGAVGYAAAGFAIGAFAGSYLASYLGRSGDAATVMALAGGVAGGILMSGASLTGSLAGLSVTGWGLVIVVIIMIYTWLIGWGETDERPVEFTCMPWQAPVGGDDCAKCNEDSLKPCSKYKCESLGQACELLNEDEENPVCQSIEYEPNPPVISPGEVQTLGYEFFNEETKKVEIRAIDGGCIPEFTPVLFTLETDEFSQCKYEFERTSNYDAMTNYPLEQNSFDINHSFAFSMPSIDSLEVYNVTGDLKEMFGDMNMFIRCQDYHGNFNIDEYAVNFCINSGPDTTAAYITKFIPEDGSYLKFGTTETNFTIYLNEPAECKYDISENKNYDEMTNFMQCNTNLLNPELYGWSCSTTLTNLNNNENKFYIKCKDKPWVQTAEDIEEYGERNINSEDFVYSIYVTANELKIDLVLPQGEIEFGFEPVSVELEAETSGGMDNGVCACYYEWAGNWVQFLDTYSSSHTQPDLNLMGGNFDIPIKCEDDAENTAYGNAVFNISVDSEPPIITENYTEANNLKLITDELAECYYHPDKCNFNFENGTSMTTALSTEHTIYDLNPRTTYHVKCADVWGNTNPDCAIIIQPTEVDDGTPPIVVRVFHDYGDLKIITDEQAECYYNFNKCDFDFEDSTSMTTALSVEHYTNWIAGQTYHIKCVDDWENENSGCAIIVKPSKL